MKILITAALVSMLFSEAASAQTDTLFGNTVPGTPVVDDPNAVTLGMKFYATMSGTISGIRFYRGHTNRNGYTVSLYNGNGSRIAQTSHSGDTCKVPCWESVNFASPIAILANTTYVAAYYSSNGEYAADDNGMKNGFTNGPLVAWASNVAGGNDVYTYSRGFPNKTYMASNYWVDILFTPNGPTLSLSFSPPNPVIDPASPIGTFVTTAVATWSDGSTFTGTYAFGNPYVNDGGLFGLQSNGQVFVNGDLSGLANTDQNITVVATQ
jgi:hypothetical protein